MTKMVRDTNVLIDYDACVKELREWWQTESNLPKKIDETLLRRFIHSTYGKLDYTKKVITLNYQMRNENPKIFIERDPLSPEFKKIFETADILPLLQLTPSQYRIIFYRLRDTNDANFDFLEGIKLFFTMTDTRQVVDKELALADVPVFDMKGFSLKHIGKVLRNFSALRVYMRFTQEALPVRLKHIHLVNVSSFIDRILTVLKPLMRKEVQESLKFHVPKSTTIFEFIPKEMLPKEYGGDGPSLDDLKETWKGHIQNQQDYLTNPDYWKSNSCEPEINGNISNFQALAID